MHICSGMTRVQAELRLGSTLQYFMKRPLTRKEIAMSPNQHWLGRQTIIDSVTIINWFDHITVKDYWF